MSAIIVVDAFWGDSGKGKVAAFLAQKHQAAYSVRAGIGTNAGHSILFADGSEIRTRQLPCGFLHPDTQLRVGSGVAVDPELFCAELDQLDPSYGLRERTRVDYRCPLILPEYRQREAADVFLQEHGTTASERRRPRRIRPAQSAPSPRRAYPRGLHRRRCPRAQRELPTR